MTPFLTRMCMKITVSYINPSFQTPFSLQWKYMRGKGEKSHFSVPNINESERGRVASSSTSSHRELECVGKCAPLQRASECSWATHGTRDVRIRSLLRWALGGIYDPGHFTEPFHQFPCSSQNSGALIHSPALKTWTSLKENGGEKKDIKEIKTLFALTSEIRWWQGPLKKKKLQFFLLTMPNL